MAVLRPQLVGCNPLAVAGRETGPSPCSCPAWSWRRRRVVTANGGKTTVGAPWRSSYTPGAGDRVRCTYTIVPANVTVGGSASRSRSHQRSASTSPIRPPVCQQHINHVSQDAAMRGPSRQTAGSCQALTNSRTSATFCSVNAPGDAWATARCRVPGWTAPHRTAPPGPTSAPAHTSPPAQLPDGR